MNNKSFTLIELLVVIVIIGILAGVIMISTSSSIGKANLAKTQAFSETVQNELLLDLVSEWTFNEDVSPYTTSKDTWGNSHGSVSGAAYKSKNSKECILGGCYQFDGGISNINFGDILQIGTSSWTYSLWFKGINFTHSYLISKTDNGGTPFRMALGFDSNLKIYFMLRDATNLHYGFEDENVIDFTPDTNWHNINIVINRAEELLCYLDGMELGNRDISSITNQNFLLNRPIRVGSYNDSSNNPTLSFNGLIDDVRIYNTFLSSSQIKQNYIAGLDSLLSSGTISKKEYDERVNNLAKK